MILALLVALSLDFSAPADWLARNGELLRARPISKIVLPGSHDAASYAIERGSAVCPARAGKLASLFSFVASSRARTQPVSLEQQLQSGIRYLDLRVCAIDHRYFMHHTYLAGSLDDSLAQIDRFSHAHPREILLLDFQHLNGFADDDVATLIATLETRFGSRMLPASVDPSTQTLHQLWDRGVSLIVVMDNAQSPHIFSRQAYLVSPWANASTLPDLLAALPKMASATPRLHVLQWQVTPRFAAFARHPASSLIDFAVGTNAMLLDGSLQKLLPAAQLNIVMTDDATRVAEPIARLNESLK